MHKSYADTAKEYLHNIDRKGLPYASEHLSRYLIRTKKEFKPETITGRLHYIGKELGKLLKNRKDKFDLLRQLWRYETVQERILAIDAMSVLSDEYPGEIKDFLVEMADDMHNWKISLQMAMRIISHLVIDNPEELFVILNRWMESDDALKRQIAMSCIPAFIRSREKDIDKALDFINKGMEEKDGKVIKAVAWAIREVSKKDPLKTYEFLRKWAANDNSYTKKIIEQSVKYLPEDKQREILSALG